MRKTKINTFDIGNFIIASMVVLGSMYAFSEYKSLQALKEKIHLENVENNSKKLEHIKEYSEMLAMLPKCHKVEVSYSSMKSDVSSHKSHIAINQLEKLIDNMRNGTGGRLDFSVYSSLAIKPQCNISYATNEYKFDY